MFNVISTSFQKGGQKRIPMFLTEFPCTWLWLPVTNQAALLFTLCFYLLCLIGWGFKLRAGHKLLKYIPRLSQCFELLTDTEVLVSPLCICVVHINVADITLYSSVDYYLEVWDLPVLYVPNKHIQMILQLH